jgi:hypothetical protein
MKFSESWLRTLVDPKLTSAELSHLLTMAGLEVEELDPVAPQFDMMSSSPMCWKSSSIPMPTA